MSKPTYNRVRLPRRPVLWLGGAVQTPPFSEAARKWAGRLLRKVQNGEHLPMPLSRPLPGIGERCHELRVPDGTVDWRIVYRTDPEAILVVEVFSKKTEETPKHVMETCRWRLRMYDQMKKER